MKRVSDRIMYVRLDTQGKEKRTCISWLAKEIERERTYTLLCQADTVRFFGPF